MSRAGFVPRTAAGAMRSIVEGAGSEAAAPDQVEAPTARRSLEVGAADDRAELEADAVAEKVLARIGGTGPHAHGPGCGHGDAVRRAPAPSAGATIGAAGGALDQSSSSEIESARGGGVALDAGVRREMEAGFGRSLGDVRIHTDSRADQLSQQMSARAFTTGRDIFFGKGEYDPTSAAGRKTLAHELAHTVQDGGSARRKLRGTAEAPESQGGDGNTTKGIRKKIGAKTNWDLIVGNTRAYEAEEFKLTSKGTPSASQLRAAQPGMLKLLKKVRSAVKDWRKANSSEVENDKLEKDMKQRAEQGEGLEDTRSKAGRRQAVNMLEPRVSHEITLLSSKDGAGWLSSLGLSPDKVIGTGATKSGQVNTASELHYDDGKGGTFSGYFKEDKGFAKQTQTQEDEVGITHQDPNYGARSVALYRLDQLFNAQVTARAEFAVHTTTSGESRLGTVLESAQGTSAGDTAFKLPGDDGPGVSLDDPVLQSGLNKLQILDAIAGQLDRHQGNYMIAQDKSGKVTGVTGIDLDMAFGKNMKSTGRIDTAFNYLGLPEFIDKEMGDTILKVKPTDIRNALLGLLSKSEVEATVSRFNEVQQAVRDAKKAGKLVDKWDGTTKHGGSGQDAKTRYDDSKTYQQQARYARALIVDKTIMEEADYQLRQRFQKGPFSDMPKEMETVFFDAVTPKSEYKGRSNSKVIQFLTHYMFEADLTNNRPEAMVKVLFDAMFSIQDPNKLGVELQTAYTALDRIKISNRIKDETLSLFGQRQGELYKKFDALGGKLSLIHI